jgi:hypothetical protein
MRVSTRVAAALLVVGVLGAGPCAREAWGQDTVVVSRGARPTQTTSIAQWAVDLFNAPRTLRSFGSLTIDSVGRIDGDVAVLDGPLDLYGTVTGHVVGINADVTLHAGAVVEGDVVVLGGRLEREPGSSVAGSSRSETDRVNVRRQGDRLELLGRQSTTRTYGFDERNRGRAFLIAGLGGTYNRVEGLPLRGGAGVEWQTGDVGGRIRGYGVFRTAGDFSGSREDIGYNVDGRLRFGRYPPSLTLGARGYDLVVPTQDWPLTLHEVGWGTLLWHRDYRDYFLQRGVAGYLTFDPTGTISLTGEISRVEEASIAARDPWTPWRNDEPWRPNPAIDAGNFTLLKGTLEYDSRSSIRSSRSGTLLRATWEHGVGDSIVQQPLPPEVRPALPATNYTFDRASVDLRQYQRIGWGGQLRLRGYWTGPVGGDPLPIQRRVSLGGPDPMNGYDFRAFSCNGNAADSALTGLCDHVLLFQAEYRGGFGFSWMDSGNDDRHDRRSRDHWWDDDWDWDWGDWFWFEGPSIVLFTNAGTGWLEGSDGPGKLHWDVGAGLAFGSVGLYVAKAIQEGEPIRVTLRIERRF